MTSHKRKLFADYSKPDLHWLPSVYTVLLWWTSPDTKTAFSSSPVFLLRSSLASFPLVAVGVFSIVSRVGWFAVSGSVKHSKPHRRALAPITAKGNRRWTLSYKGIMKIIILKIDRKRKPEFNHILTVIGSKILQGIMQEYRVWPNGSNCQWVKYLHK